MRANGHNISELKPFEIARLGVGFVPEDRRIFSDLTVLENLDIGRQPIVEEARRVQLGANAEAAERRALGSAGRGARAAGGPLAGPVAA